jgi:SEC-C motif
MTDHSELLDQYRRIREVRLRLNNRLVTTIPKETFQECGRKLGFLRKGVLYFEKEDDSSVLMDFCLYHPDSDGRTLVMKYLEKSSPRADPEEIASLSVMTRSYYSLFQVTDVERGVGVGVQDLLRDEPGFIIDIGLGSTAKRHMMLATRVMPMEDCLMTGGAALPLDASAAKPIFEELIRMNMAPGTFDFHAITPQKEADLATLVIRTCRSTGMFSHVAYATPGRQAIPESRGSEERGSRRNVRCPCGSGKKYRACCGRR